jgi:hypothetical protein
MRRLREARPDDDFSSVLSVNTPYRALWCAVIKQAWADATTTGHVADLDVRTARAWPRYKNFELVCSLAGINSEIIEKLFKKSPKSNAV